MSVQLLGLDEIHGSLVALDHVKNVSNEEMVRIQLKDGSVRKGRVVAIEGEKAVIQVFEGTDGISLNNATARSSDGTWTFQRNSWSYIQWCR